MLFAAIAINDRDAVRRRGDVLIVSPTPFEAGREDGMMTAFTLLNDPELEAEMADAGQDVRAYPYAVYGPEDAHGDREMLRRCADDKQVELDD